MQAGSVPVRRRGRIVPAAVALLVGSWLLAAAPAAAHALVVGSNPHAGWRIVSADDGHLEAGSFAFAVGTGSGPVTSPAPSQLPTPWQVAGRWLETAGVLDD